MGTCPACAHPWAEHLPPDPCSECTYERDHGQRIGAAGLCWKVPPGDPPAQADRRLDVYRNRYAKVFDGDEPQGFLWTFVETWWTREGPWWRRRWTNPTELPHWIWVDEREFRDDGVVDRHDLGRELADWGRGEFMYRGRRLRLIWLSDPDAEAVRRSYFADS